MGLHEKLNKCMADRDVTSYLNLLHDDFTVVFHKSGNSFNKEEWASLVTGMLENEKFVQEVSRLVYENDEISVDHSFMSYPDNSREAEMLIAMIKDSKIVKIETGATTLD